MTSFGQLQINYMCLIASTEADSEKLKKNFIYPLVFPLDEALAISKLPYKLTSNVMLTICKKLS
jgi:hypothetical protein